MQNSQELLRNIEEDRNRVLIDKQVRSLSIVKSTSLRFEELLLMQRQSLIESMQELS